MQQISFEIDGAQDFELGIARTSRLAYHCTLPPGRARGLVFVIPGFGDDAGTEYNQVLRRYLCGRHGLAAVTVDYHCSQARPPKARYELQLDELQRVLGYLASRKIHLDPDFDRPDLFFRDLQTTGVSIALRATLVPPNGDYQNFGVMQAIDHLCVLNDILDSGADFDRDNIICFGSSHGAYLAHLVHKFAPNTVNAVIDISGYAVPLARFVGSGAEIDINMGNVKLACNLITKWSFTDDYASEFFGPARFAIRDAMNPRHFAAISAHTHRKCQFRMVTSAEDALSPTRLKLAQCALLRAHGFDAQLKIVTAADLDGKMFKSLAHGLDASMSAVFDSYVDSIAVRPTRLDRVLKTALDLECYDHVYRIRHHDTAPSFEASCEPIEAPGPN